MLQWHPEHMQVHAARAYQAEKEMGDFCTADLRNEPAVVLEKYIGESSTFTSKVINPEVITDGYQAADVIGAGADAGAGAVSSVHVRPKRGGLCMLEHEQEASLNYNVLPEKVTWSGEEGILAGLSPSKVGDLKSMHLQFASDETTPRRCESGIGTVKERPLLEVYVGQPNFMEANITCAQKQEEDVQEFGNNGLALFELEEARKDLVRQAHDRRVSFGLQHSLPASNRRPCHQNMIIDAVPHPVSASSEPESVPLIPNVLGSCLGPPAVSISDSDGKNTVHSAGTSHRYKDVEQSSEMSKYLTCASNGPKIGTVQNIPCHDCQGLSVSSTYSVQPLVKLSGELGKGKDLPHSYSFGEKQQDGFRNRDVDQLSQIKDFRKADNAMQRCRGRMWVDRFLNKGSHNGSNLSEYLAGHSILKKKLHNNASHDCGSTLRKKNNSRKSSLDCMEKAVSSGDCVVYMLSKRSKLDSDMMLTFKNSTPAGHGLSERLAGSKNSEGFNSDSLYVTDNTASEDTNGCHHADDFSTNMSSVKDWVEECKKHMANVCKEESTNAVPSLCFFCGMLGHTISNCSEIRDYELHELYEKILVMDGLKHDVGGYCLHCDRKGHWGAECYLSEGSIKETELNKEQDRGHEDDVCEVMLTKCQSYNLLPNSINENVQEQLWANAGSVDVNLRHNYMRMAGLSYVSNGRAAMLSMSILKIIESIRLSRADLLNCANQMNFSVNMKGFFLRLRFGKWEEELGGTGYRMACITDASVKVNFGVKKLTILVDLGDVECTVDSQYVSNQGFTEVELAEWWQATKTSGKSLPQERELQAKVEERRAWPF